MVPTKSPVRIESVDISVEVVVGQQNDNCDEPFFEYSLDYSKVVPLSTWKLWR